MNRAFITGTAGFIGFHLAELLLQEGWDVAGYDGMTDYYDVALKRRRHDMLQQHPRFSATEAMLEDKSALDAAVEAFAPNVIVHLAAQAGVRYSLENPRAYVDANVIGSFNVMETAREAGVQHLLMASTSSVYGANEDMPFVETEKADTQLTIYAATKKATESMGHSWAHIYRIPITMFRFFTVYGPWGRPDMALFKFTKGIRGLIDAVPGGPETEVAGDSLSPVAPFRIVNIGNSEKVRLLDFIDAIEAELGRAATRNFMGMQTGDVPATWADATLLHRLTGYRPQTDFREGVARFVRWYWECY